MKTYREIIIATLAGLLVVGGVWAAFPAALNNWQTGDIITEEWGNNLEATIGITNSSVTASHDYMIRDRITGAYASSTYLSITYASTTYLGISFASTTYLQLSGGGVVTASSTFPDLSISRLFVNPVQTQSITSAADQITSSITMAEISSNADYVLTSIPNIATGTDGQFLIIKNTGNFTIDLQDNSVLSGSDIFLSGGSGVINPDEIITFIYLDSIPGWSIQSHPNIVAGGDATVINVRNVSGVIIAERTPVYASGFNSGQNRIQIELAEADVDGSMPAMGLTLSSISNGANGQVITSGLLANVSTSDWSIGASIYVDIIAGELTNTRPSVDNIQGIGTVVRSHASKGEILIQGAGRTNDVKWNSTSTSIYLTQLGINTDYFTDLTGTALSITSGSLGVTAGGIGNTQLAFNTGQHLTSTSYPTFAGLILTISTTTGSLVIPQGSAPVVDEVGEIALDTTDNQLLVADSSGIARVIRTTDKIFSFTLASTSVDFISGGSIPVPVDIDGYTVTKIRCYVENGTSTVATLTDGTNAMDSITCTIGVASDDGNIANSTVNAEEKMKVDIGTITGDVSYLTFSVFGVWTRE